MNNTIWLLGQCCTSKNGGKDYKKIVSLIWHINLICERVVIHRAKRSASEELMDYSCPDVYRVNSSLPCCDINGISRWKREILRTIWHWDVAKLLFRQAIEDCKGTPL